MNGFRRLLPRGYRLADWLMACAAPLCLLWLLEGFSRGDAGSVPVWAVSQPGLFAINYALYAAPCLLLCLVPSRRARLCSLLALGLLCAVLGIARAISESTAWNRCCFPMWPSWGTRGRQPPAWRWISTLLKSLPWRAFLRPLSSQQSCGCAAAHAAGRCFLCWACL